MKTPDYLEASTKKIWTKWSIAFRITPLVVLLAILKFVAHYLGWEVMELNALFTSLVAGTIFLIGFLVSGVLADYKESEKIPSEIVATLRTLLDDTITISQSKNPETALRFIEFQRSLPAQLLLWFAKKERTSAFLKTISSMNAYFIAMEKEGVLPNYLIKLKTEQNTLRKLVMRVDTIRDTDFVGSAYAILEAMGFLVALGLVIIRIEPFYASLFFTLLVTFLILYMFFLIRDLDNPFDYQNQGESGTEIPLKPLHDFKRDFDDLSTCPVLPAIPEKPTVS
jgi:hypothetical protein